MNNLKSLSKVGAHGCAPHDLASLPNPFELLITLAAVFETEVTST